MPHTPPLLSSPSTTNASALEEQSSLLSKAKHKLQQYTPQAEQRVKSVMEEFQAFIAQGDMINLAIGLILGKAFSEILDSFVVDILAPIISLFSERSIANNFFVAKCPNAKPQCHSKTWETWDEAREAGAVTINYGLFLENVVNFLINALFLYIAVKKVSELIFKHNVTLKKKCPYCKEFVKGAATICKNCGSHLE